MKKIIIILLVIFGCTARIDAQTLSEAEVVAKMNEAFELDKAKKKAEIEARKQAIRTEDIARGVFIPVSSLPQLGPRKGA